MDTSIDPFPGQSVFLKIAYRNILKNPKRSVLVGLTLVISCTLLLLSFSIGNGAGRQIINKYRNFQSGDVTVLWKNVKKIDGSDPSRLFFSKFEIKHDRDNRFSIRRLHDFIKQNAGEIAAYYPSIRNEGMLDTGRYASFSIIFGVTPDEMQFWDRTRTFQLTAGVLPFANQDGICISDDLARQNRIRIGDWITVDSTTLYGLVNSLEYQVVGLYRSSSEFDNIYIYMSRESALELFDQDPVYFRSFRIYLKNPASSHTFAKRLDRYLTAGNGELRAEPMAVSAQFYSTIAGFLKSLFSFFVIFILLLIAVGIRSTVRLNIFERFREFGTLRAMGFHRSQSFLIIFLEIFLLALLSLSIATVCTLLLVGILNQTGLYIGKGTIAYALGGESIYPVFQWGDLAAAFLIITVFAIFAPLKPGLQLCYQKITDLLAQNQKPVMVLLTMLGWKRGANQKRSIVDRINKDTMG
jgi:ABC-type lipoprotein release transport system permease subunit